MHEEQLSGSYDRLDAPAISVLLLCMNLSDRQDLQA